MSGSNVEIFRGRGDARGAALDRLGHPTYGAGAIATADLEGQFRIATALSNATDAMPRGYRKQPGAVLLALAWGQQHGVDILTAIQSVAFVEGKAVVDATMQRALAKRAGYALAITVSTDEATVGVSQGGQRLGEATYTMDEAEVAGLAKKPNWVKNRQDMLVARATTRAVRRFAPDVLLGMLVGDEVDAAPELVDLVDSEPENETPPDPEPDHSATMADEAPSPNTAGEGADSGEWASADAMRDELRARGVSVADAVREAQALAKSLGVPQPAGTMAAIWGHSVPEFRDAWVGWVRVQGGES